MISCATVLGHGVLKRYGIVVEMKTTKKTIVGGRRIAALSICAGCLLSGTTAMAAISYSYENDGKTYVLTVDSCTNWLQEEHQTVLNKN